jgi:hypothetical protein
MESKATSPRQAGAIVAGAVLLINVLLLLAAMAALVHLVSRVPWPAPGDQLGELIAGCQRIHGISARHHCVETVIADAQRRASVQRLAAAAPGAGSGDAASAVGR